jgi:hypothetical protein
MYLEGLMATGRKERRGNAAVSELRLRIGGVEIAVVGESRADCLRQLEAAAREVDGETRLAETRWGLTEAGRRALAEVA